MPLDQSWIADLLAGYRTIQVNGQNLPQENTLNFTGVTGTDNSSAGVTNIAVSGGSSGGAFAPFQAYTASDTLTLTQAASQSWYYGFVEGDGTIELPTSPQDGDVVVLAIANYDSSTLYNPAEAIIDGGPNPVVSPYASDPFLGPPGAFSVYTNVVQTNVTVVLVYEFSSVEGLWILLSQSGLENVHLEYIGNVGAQWTLPPSSTLEIDTITIGGSNTDTVVFQPGTFGFITILDSNACRAGGSGSWGTYPVIVGISGDSTRKLEDPAALGTITGVVHLSLSNSAVTWAFDGWSGSSPLGKVVSYIG